MEDDNGRLPDNQHHQQDPLVERTALVPAWAASDRAAAISLSQKVYPRKSVLAAAYKLADRCAILIDIEADERWIAYLIAPPGRTAKAFLPDFILELGDQALREQLETEFRDVRTLIVAQAFAEGNLLDPKRDDTNDRLDPYGTEQRR